MNPAPERRYPGPVLRTASDYGWRLIVVGTVLYLLVRGLSQLTTVVIPCIVALLVTALLHPLQVLLRRAHLPRGLATVVSFLVAVVVIAGVVFLVIDRAIAQAPQFGDQINRLIPDVERWLEDGPLQVSRSQVSNFSSTLSKEVSKNSSALASAALSTSKTAVEVLTGLVLAIFVTIFLLYDGDGIWQFLLRAVPTPGRGRADRAGRAAWLTLSHYMRGTLVVAAFHGIVIAAVLLVLGVPVVAPLALIVALGSFVPIVGAVVAGLLAAGVATIEQGLAAGIVVVIVLVVDNQVEAHLLQPFVVGRYIHVHPLAVVLALATGALSFGIFGAIIAVPTMACVNSAVRAALVVAEPDEAMDPDRVPPEPDDDPLAVAR
jgi:predicted PurR-regulated permease PerM